MYTNGVIIKHFCDFSLLFCAACVYAKETKHDCNTKTTISINEYKPVASVGDFVSVDAFVSSIPGLIVEISGFIVHKHYHYACVFVDHSYGFTYVNILKSQTGHQAVKVKGDFDMYAEYHGFYIKNYHDENGNI